MRTTAILGALFLAAQPCFAARTFVRASSQYVTSSTVPITGYPATICAWFNSVDTTNTQHVVVIGASGVEDGFSMRARGNIAGDPLYCASVIGGAGVSCATSNGYSANTWHAACCMYVNSTNTYGNLDNGTACTPVGSATTPTGFGAMRVGTIFQTGAGYFDGRIAEVSVWDIEIGASDVAAFSRRVDPRLIRPDHLVSYAPLMGRASPEPDLVGGAVSFTLVNTPTSGDHPAIIRPTGPIALFHYAAAAGGGTFFFRRTLSPLGTRTGSRQQPLLLIDQQQEEIPCVGCPR